jgi:hypothetical protein
MCPEHRSCSRAPAANAHTLDRPLHHRHNRGTVQRFVLALACLVSLSATLAARAERSAGHSAPRTRAAAPSPTLAEVVFTNTVKPFGALAPGNTLVVRGTLAVRLGGQPLP